MEFPDWFKLKRKHYSCDKTYDKLKLISYWMAPWIKGGEMLNF